VEKERAKEQEFTGMLEKMRAYLEQLG